MNKIIIYGSNYGTAKKYSEEMSKLTDIKAIDYKKNKDINQYDTIIYFGSLYAGGILGLSKTLKKITDISKKNIIIATVGISDPKSTENITNIQNNLKRQVSEEIFNTAKIYHLRGAIDYSTLRAPHKIMMSLLYKSIKKLPEEKKTDEIKGLIETYNKTVDFVDFSSLTNIINAINQ